MSVSLIHVKQYDKCQMFICMASTPQAENSQTRRLNALKRNLTHYSGVEANLSREGRKQ